MMNNNIRNTKYNSDNSAAAGLEPDGGFHPVWLTLPQMADIHPISLWHREQEEFTVPAQAKELKNVHVLARSSFFLCQESSLQLRISADDRYKLYLDGKFVQEGPAPSHPEHYYYNTIVLPAVSAGRHVLGVHLYYQGCINRVYYSKDMRLALAAELTDEQSDQIPLDFYCKATQAYSGSLIGYDTQYLENFDARLFPADWNLDGFDDAGWEQMKPAGWADYTLYPQPVKMLDHYEAAPEHIWRRTDGSILVDLGREITGNMHLRAAGKAGDRIIIRCGEELEDSGTDTSRTRQCGEELEDSGTDISRSCQNGCSGQEHVRYHMRCGCTYEEVWTLDHGENIWEPFDYKGFRYCELLPDHGVDVKEIRSVMRHYPMDDSLCTLQTDQDILDRIFEICRHAVRLGTQEGYIDCPTREKGQYLGDAIITAHAHVLLTGDTDMLLKCIEQFSDTARVCPGLLAVAPGGLMQEIADFSLLFPQLVLLHYRMTGDRKALGRSYDTVEQIVKYFQRHARANGLLEQAGEKWNLVDWPENLRDGYDFELSRPVVAAGCHNVINALYLGAVTSLMQMAELLGRPAPYKKELEGWKKAYYAAFYRKKTGLLADSEVSGHSALHSNVYALYFQLVPLEARARMLDFIEEKGFSCGVMHSYFVLRVLAHARRYDAMYRLLVNESRHGWVQMLREGATACFEAWGRDQKWNTSLCHPWASAPVPIILEEIAGIHPDPKYENGYYFEPHIPEFIKYFHAEMPFRGKRVVVEKKDGKVLAAWAY